MTERLDRSVEARRLRRVGAQRRDDDQHAGAGQHDTLGDIARDTHGGDGRSAVDKQILEELLGGSLIDGITADQDEPYATAMRMLLPQPDCIMLALSPAFC